MSYEDLTTQGTHRHEGDTPDAGINVRAQEPPNLVDHSGETGPAGYQLLWSENEGRYVLRAWRQGDTAVPGEGYSEVGRYEREADFDTVLEALPDQPRFVVFENSETGEVYFDRDSSLSDNWTEDGRFDQFTVFADEASAAAYADEHEAPGRS